MIKKIDDILINIENEIKDEKELEYFWTHSERYKYILHKIIVAYYNIALQNKKVLDIGCYPYHLGKALEELGFDVYGISSKHEPIDNNPKIKILNIETDKFPFKNDDFDIVLCSEVIEHLLRTPKIPLKEIKRILKKDGVLIITTPNALRSINRISMLIGRNIYPKDKDFYDEKAGDASYYFRHNKEYTMKELEELLEEVGFQIKNKEYFISYTPFRKRKIPDNVILKTIKLINYTLMKVIPQFRDTIYIEAKSKY